MMNDDAFAQMKPTAFLINCARGPIVDTAALVRALDAGRIAGCGARHDRSEPLPDPHPLRGRENVIITPHAAWYSEQAMVGLQAGAPSESPSRPHRAVAAERGHRAVKGKSRAGL